MDTDDENKGDEKNNVERPIEEITNVQVSSSDSSDSEENIRKNYNVELPTEQNSNVQESSSDLGYGRRLSQRKFGSPTRLKCRYNTMNHYVGQECKSNDQGKFPNFRFPTLLATAPHNLCPTIAKKNRLQATHAQKEQIELEYFDREPIKALRMMKSLQFPNAIHWIK